YSYHFIFCFNKKLFRKNYGVYWRPQYCNAFVSFDRYLFFRNEKREKNSFHYETTGRCIQKYFCNSFDHCRFRNFYAGDERWRRKCLYWANLKRYAIVTANSWLADCCYNSRLYWFCNGCRINNCWNYVANSWNESANPS